MTFEQDSILLRRTTLFRGITIARSPTGISAWWAFCGVETRAPRGDERLAAGAHYQIPPKTAHRISNGGGEDCQFLLLQGVGAYDFNKVQE